MGREERIRTPGSPKSVRQSGSSHPEFGRSRFLGLSAGFAGAVMLGGGVLALEGCGSADEERASGEDLYDEPFRGQIHFSPKRNWINDPNGMVYYRGEYHLFYQYNPSGSEWGNISWGHAVSPDMLDWEELPVALRPDDLGAVFSGSAVVDEDDTSGFFDGGSGMVAIYTSAGGEDFTEQVQSVAYSRDRGRTWIRYEGNPVIPGPDIKDFRDPKVFRHARTNRWLMVLAAGDRVMFYGSEDLKDWEKLSEFGADDGAHGGVWECPDLFELPVGETGTRRWVLQVDINPGGVSGGSGAQYFIGDFDGEKFVNENPPERVLWADWGKDFYATQDWNDTPDGRRIWIAWMNNWQYANEIPTDPWRGSMTLPREVTLSKTDDGVRLAQSPIRELDGLRRGGYRRENVEVSEDGLDEDLPKIDGRTVEIVASFDPGDAAEFGLMVRQGEGERTVVGYDMAAQEIFVDRRESGQSDFSEDFAGRHAAPAPQTGGSVEMRVFVDRSSVEVFADGGRAVITDRIFPGEESRAITPYARSGRTILESLEVYELESVWR